MTSSKELYYTTINLDINNLKNYKFVLRCDLDDKIIYKQLNDLKNINCIIDNSFLILDIENKSILNVDISNKDQLIEKFNIKHLRTLKLKKI